MSYTGTEKQKKWAREYARRWRASNPHYKEWMKKWKADNAEKLSKKWRINLLKKHGLTPEQYQEKLVAQGNVCAICKKTPADGSNLYVDHDHTTNQIRGLLCRKCNFAIGLFNDCIEFLLSAITYLRFWRDNA